jgi:colanic acid/amylovoran biosynthesis glycosyltransferase
MRVAFLTSEFPVLSETPFLNQMTGLVRRGHEVDIFADKPQPGVPAHPDIEKLRLLAKTRYPIPLPAGQRWRAAVGILSSHRGEARRMLLRSMNPFLFWQRAWSLEQFRRTAAFLPTRPYDVCYCAFGQDAVKAMRIRRVGALDGKMVVAFRGADTTKYVARRGPKTYAEVFRSGSLFLPVCDALARRLVAMGAPPEKVVVHHTGIDLTRWVFRPPRFDGAGQLRLLTIARLVEKKGIEYVLHAVRHLVDRGVDVRYDILGDGPLRTRLTALCLELGITDRVRLAGWETQDGVEAALSRAHILIAASLTAGNQDEEGIPNVLKEAMAVGIPVVATRHSGIPELVDDGVSGMLVPERDTAALVGRIHHLFTHPDEWAALGANGRAKIEREFDIEHLNNRFVELLDGLRSKG